jgi:hypothetical protein
VPFSACAIQARKKFIRWTQSFPSCVSGVPMGQEAPLAISLFKASMRTARLVS